MFLSCEESGTIPEQTANFERSEEVNFNELMVIEKGVLTFKDKESFNKLNEFAYSSKANLNQLIKFLESKSFENLYSFYNNLTEDDLSEVFEKQKVTDEFSKYLVLEENVESDYDLEEKFKLVYLQLYMNKDLLFKVGSDFVKVSDGKVIYSQANGEEIVLQNSVKKQNRDLKSMRGTSNSINYDSGGRRFKLEIEAWSETGYEPITVNGVSLKFYTLVQYEALHKRRSGGIFWKTNTSQIRVSGNHYQADASGNGGFVPDNWVNFDSFIVTNNSDAFMIGFHINSYTATAWCIGFDGDAYQVSTSGTF